jgi:ATP-dependent helicase/nuclease subunit B
MPLSAADRGSAIHDALGEFTQKPDRFPTSPRWCWHRREIDAPDGTSRGARCGGHDFNASPHGLRTGNWRGATTSPGCRRDQGEIKIPLDNEYHALRGDRIEQRRDGSFAILDYKTGQPPTGKQVRMGLSPQ